MRAAVVTENGVEIQDVAKPAPKPHEVLVRVRACGLNRADLMVASGMAHGAIGGSGTIVGQEFSGEIVATGSEVRGMKEGDRVMCHGTASWADYALADWGSDSTDTRRQHELRTSSNPSCGALHDA